MGKNRKYNSGQKRLRHTEVRRWQPYNDSWYTQGQKKAWIKINWKSQNCEC
ncbi:hypothetical protein NIES267_73420 (plasmid) [Calothrix parasitica NIES-267]|uniref:Uncharacterized protein n=1 Tax=Calothrix parasitica NIES-267 TaxID=1973488 RepID=A0A1Z4M360_9CYAN|nr:hypothetical protein NIES267_73420 [Calothrix parasitica NIES-267]